MTIKRKVMAGVGAGALAAMLLAARRGENPNPLPAGTVADRILVEKGARRLTLFRGDQTVKTYQISLGGAPVGQKAQEGDKRTPEGPYAIDRRLRASSCHRALHISYPTAQQTAAATAKGVSPGGNIMIHGLRNGLGWLGSFHRQRDWTAGCVAVTNLEIEELWRVVPDGTPIEIRP